MLKRFICLCALFFLIFNSYSQYLDKISPFILSGDIPTDSISFILTATDFHAFQGHETRYPSSVQIIDAANPWPPRWFAVPPLNIRRYFPDSIPEPLNQPLINASLQGNQITMYSKYYTKNENNELVTRNGIIFCDQDLNFTRAFGGEIFKAETQDFRINTNGENIYFVRRDTTMDMRSVFSDNKDSAVELTYQIIEIADSANHITFSWDPIAHFGINALYLPYRYSQGIITTFAGLNWSHGSSVCWDTDGNILYSYKNIGVGKISRQDGHIIWRVDRNNPKPNEGSDSIPVFKQHDFKSFIDKNGRVIYTVLSNGDNTRPYPVAYQFTVTPNDTYEFVLKLIRKLESKGIPNTHAGGNYDFNLTGNYIINYGYFLNDSAAYRLCFEWRDSSDKILAQYKVPSSIICYRVHKLESSQIRRPEVTVKDEWLYGDEKLKEVCWYLLSGPENTLVTKVGKGHRFKPTESGLYVMTVRCGIGYAVSLPIMFEK